MENINEKYECIVEYILYKRDRNNLKDWWHIRWWTTIFSYCRWNRDYNYLNKYSSFLELDYVTEDNFLLMLKDWYYWNFELKYLEKYFLEFSDNYLYNFLCGISKENHHEYDYYFCFSESINEKGFEKFLKSFKQNPNYLFTNIALWSYYQHNQNLDLSYKFYLNSLKIDKNNPYVLAKLAILYSSKGWKNWLIQAEKTMWKVINLLPDIPWVNAWYWETLNMIWKYYEALKYFEIYENLTKWKHRTFEPFMRKAESYIWLGDFKKARTELNKESKYYFWEWYRFVYNDLDKKLKNLWY